MKNLAFIISNIFTYVSNSSMHTVLELIIQTPRRNTFTHWTTAFIYRVFLFVCLFFNFSFSIFSQNTVSQSYLWLVISLSTHFSVVLCFTYNGVLFFCWCSYSILGSPTSWFLFIVCFILGVSETLLLSKTWGDTKRYTQRIWFQTSQFILVFPFSL